MSLTEAFVLFLIMCEVVCVAENKYMGEKFPQKYLHPEEYTPTKQDVDTYLEALGKVVSSFASEPNKTDTNRAITVFFLKAIFKKVLLEDGHKLEEYQKRTITQILYLGDYILSHNLYQNMINAKFGAIYKRIYVLTQWFRDDEILTKSLPDFNRNNLKKWILARGEINEYIQDIDNATLPRDVYTKLTGCKVKENYHIKINISDECLGRVSWMAAPHPEDKTWRACRPDPLCKSNIHAFPSIAYGLSHRMLNAFIYRHVRRCYWVSPRDDELHIEGLCAFMYRESVYLARRGFFARDMFLEHVGLCAMMGYEEFFRQHWFKKAVSWIDSIGCIHEDRNFSRNTSTLECYNTTKISKIKSLKRSVKQKCHSHPMAVLIMFLSNAVRHAVHFMEKR